MPSSTTTVSSVLLSFAVGVALGACLVQQQKRSRATAQNVVCNDNDNYDETTAMTAAATKNIAEASTTTRPRQLFQSPMTKARSNAPLNTVKKKTRTKSSSSAAAAAATTTTTPTALSPMTMARKEEGTPSSSSSSKLTPRALVMSEENDNTELKSSTQIRLVVQRYGQASILVQPNETVRVDQTENDHVGLLVYISFAKTATPTKLLQAAKTILNLPILTRGVWGDGTGTLSVLDMAALQQQNQQGVSIMLVPQANLISKVKSFGKSIQYHGQIDKESGQLLYGKFVQYLQALVVQHQCSCRNQTLPKTCATLLSPQQESQQVDASVPPSEMFLQSNKYSSWDDNGMPLTTVEGQPLTKSATKKLKKQYDAQRKRYEKYLLKTSTQKTDTTSTKPTNDDDSSSWLSLLDPNFIQVVPGTFGNLQALELKSDMGPFCHVIDL